MARTGIVSKDPLTASDIRERLELARQLVAVGGEQLKRAQTDFDLARLGLQELEADLAVRGVGAGGAQ